MVGCCCGCWGQLDKMSYDDAMEDKVEGYKREVASIESMLKFV